MKKYFQTIVSFLSSLLLVLTGCTDEKAPSLEKVKKTFQDVDKEQKYDSLYNRIEFDNLDTVITCFGTPDSLSLKNDILTIQILGHPLKGYAPRQEKFDLTKIAGVKSNNPKQLFVVLNYDSPNYKEFTPYFQPTLINLSDYSLVNTNYKLISYPRRYRGGPIYFHLENDSSRINFDYKELVDIEFLFQLSENKMLLMFNEHVDDKDGHMYYLGIFDVSKYRKYTIVKGQQ